MLDNMHRHFLTNLKGTFMYLDIPLVDFDIQNKRLVYVNEYSRSANFGYYPFEFVFNDRLYYDDFNDYYRNHSVEDGAQDYREYLKCLGLQTYDLTEITKRNNGHNHVNQLWIRFDNFGAKTYKELKAQIYPISTDTFDNHDVIELRRQGKVFW